MIYFREVVPEEQNDKDFEVVEEIILWSKQHSARNKLRTLSWIDTIKGEKSRTKNDEDVAETKEESRTDEVFMGSIQGINVELV